MSIDQLDRKIIEATQEGLPLAPEPYAVVAQQVGSTAAEVMTRMERMLESGVIRRVGVVPNHYALGYQANGMTVWDLPDDAIERLGPKVGALDFVSHCYQRPRHPPLWNYNLFVMVHGKSKEEVESKVEAIAQLLGEADRGHEILYSSKILKKTGLRIGG